MTAVFLPAHIERARGWPLEWDTAARPDRVVLVIDAPAIERNETCGMIVAARQGRHIAILADRTVHGAPNTWAQEAVTAAIEFNATDVFSTENPRFDILLAILQSAGMPRAVQHIRSRLSLRAQAEQVAGLYEARRVHHPVRLPELEAEFIRFGHQAGRFYPDRMVAALHAVTELMPGLKVSRETSPPDKALKRP